MVYWEILGSASRLRTLILVSFSWMVKSVDVKVPYRQLDVWFDLGKNRQPILLKPMRCLSCVQDSPLHLLIRLVNGIIPRIFNLELSFFCEICVRAALQIDIFR